MSKTIRTIFLGTPDFALPSLQALCRDTDFEVLAVITQSDMPVGRKQELQETPVKTLAKQSKIKNIWQPQKITQILDNIRELKPDVLVVAAYAQIIPQVILDIPQYGCINVHGSLLPKYRGAAVVSAPILNNDQTSGITIMLMDANLDTGPILRQAEISLTPIETAVSLYNKLADLGGKIINQTIKDYIAKKIEPQVQDNSQASYVKRLKKEDGIIDWNKPAKEIECFVRAMFDWPSAWTWTKGKQLKILAVEPTTVEINIHKVGKTFLYNNQLAVQCGQDAIIIKQLQLEGKNILSAKEFLNGQPDFVGNILG
ncbi:MAG: methionyl-tRNA formyltransferase [bacterium]